MKMKVYTIEIAAAIEAEMKKFLADWGGGYPMRFTRFVNIGGKQTDLHVYPAAKDASPWLAIRIKSVYKSEQGECMLCAAQILGTEKRMEEVMVSPETWKLPALADRVLNFARNDMLIKIGEGGGAPLPGAEAAVGSGNYGQGAEDEDAEDDENFDTSGILAGDGGGVEFDMDAMLAEAGDGGSAASGDDDVDPSELLRRMAEESDDEEDSSKA